MQAIDQFATAGCGIPSSVLMENAGLRTVDAMREKFPDLTDRKVLVFVGKGNNGGDGFVVARHLFDKGIDVQTILLGKREQIQGDARLNANIAFKIGVPVKEIDDGNLHSFDHALRHCHIVVDALFGTGLKAAAQGIHATVIEKINAAGKFVVAVDIPSGIDSDTGQLAGPHVRADLTVALALPKRSHWLFPAAGVMGEIRIVDIGIPQKAANQISIAVNLIEESDVRGCFKKRPADSHKGSYGHALVIGGSRGKAGAAALMALAALRTGAGLVTLAYPKSCAQHPMEAMTVPLPETPDGCIDRTAKDAIFEQLRGKTSVAIGPGISTDPATVGFLEDILPAIECPLVIDADGLNCLAMSRNLLSRLKPGAILTPHPKEMSRLCGKSPLEILEKRLETASEFAVKNTVYLILKGARTVIAAPDGSVYINPTGNPGMATGGTGDVLTGMIAGLLAQGFDARPACISGAYLHGLAGDIYADNNSETSLIAGDLLRTLPESMRRILP